MNNTKKAHCQHAFWIEMEQESAVAVRIDIAVLEHTLPMKHATPEEFKLVQPRIVANLIILSDTASQPGRQTLCNPPLPTQSAYLSAVTGGDDSPL